MNKIFIKKIFFFFMFLFVLFNISITPVSAIKENIIINDEANLITEKEEEALKEVMEPILEFGGVAFVTTDSNLDRTDNYAEKMYRNYFGNDSGIIFVIDMNNREIYIFSDGTIHKYIKNSRAYDITANVYRYASLEEYYTCAKEAFVEIEKILNHDFIFTPMRYITGVLAGICTSLVICISIVYIQRKQSIEIDDITETKYEIALKKRTVMTKQTKRIHTSSSGGGSSGGGGGGGSSGGGGGHSF